MCKKVIFKIAGGNKHSDEKMSLKNVSFLAERKNNTQIGNWDFTLGCILVILAYSLRLSWIAKDGAQPDQGAQLRQRSVSRLFHSTEDWTHDLRGESHFALTIAPLVRIRWTIECEYFLLIIWWRKNFWQDI